MKNVSLQLAIVLTVSLGLALSASTEEKKETTEKSRTLSAFDWMLGRWSLTTKSGVTIETWSKESDTLYRGGSVMMRGNDTAFYEQLSLVHDSIGIAYIALPKQNTEPTRFALSVWDKTKAVFENQSHDFPKVIRYEFKSPDTLHARIEGPGKDGKTNGIDFVYTRMKTP